MSTPRSQGIRPSMALITFMVAAAGILFEIFLGAFGSYLFGDSVRIFGITTGSYLFFMGVGAFAIRADHPRPLRTLLWIEFALVLLHLLSPLAIWEAMARGSAASPIFWAVLAISGTAVGTEIPLVLALMREKQGSSDTSIHWVLASDYLGALAASIAFGFFILPELGLFAVAWSAALLGAIGTLILSISYSRPSASVAAALLVLASALAVGFSPRVQDTLERRWYLGATDEKLVHREWTGFSDLALTSHSERGLTLYLDRQFQWSLGRDLDYYHEALAVPAAAGFRQIRGQVPRNALILGGGDGFLADRLLRIFNLESVTIIDIDPRISELARRTPEWREAGGSAVDSPRVRLIHEDAYSWVIRDSRRPEPRSSRFDLVFMDLPDPRSAALARFFTTSFFAHLRRLAPDAVLSIQASSEARQPGGAERYTCTVLGNLSESGAWAVAIPGKEQDAFILASWSGKIPTSFQAEPSTLRAARWFNSNERMTAWFEGGIGVDGKPCASARAATGQSARHSLLRPGILDL